MWKFFEFCFGNANWPSEAIWRVSDSGERQRLYSGPAARADVETLRSEYEDAGSPGVEPQFRSWVGRQGEQMYVLQYWYTFLDDEVAQDEWDWCMRAAVGEPKEIEWADSTALYEK